MSLWPTKTDIMSPFFSAFGLISYTVIVTHLRFKEMADRLVTVQVTVQQLWRFGWLTVKNRSALKFRDFSLFSSGGPAAGKTRQQSSSWPTLSAGSARSFKNYRDCQGNRLFACIHLNNEYPSRILPPMLSRTTFLPVSVLQNMVRSVMGK